MLNLLKNEYRRFSKAFTGEVYPYKHWNIQRKAIYVHIPKCGGTSLTAILAKKQQGRCHAKWDEYKNTNEYFFSHFYKLTFLRDPITRLASGFNYIVSGGARQPADLYRQKALLSFASDFRSFLKKANPTILLTFKEFQPQWTFICNEKMDLMVDFVGTIENYDSDFKTLCTNLNIPYTRIPEKNQGNYEQEEISAPQFILDFYQYDFELHNRFSVSSKQDNTNGDVL